MKKKCNKQSCGTMYEIYCRVEGACEVERLEYIKRQPNIYKTEAGKRLFAMEQQAYGVRK